ncbi:isoprenylcysteine carboxylmethyltransferase family protein [Sinorhizobium sp. NFACC03]|uniref:methyltransferase family protein n=1 Tax=Sinorhizobium sp. NFACC03 TaxID=1566295 RepID=UPI0008896215|nr:isoprenylcysteine carboxylmethyltransferase family protein [Sinorhizobium sp. NFACC03]SDA91313.1 Protein-S-isoprenylcysteine O-methyltransferase Ste14 [Sinorhizobium sp. NFACC03]
MSNTLPAILMLIVGLFTLALAMLRRVQSGRSPVVMTYGDDAEGFTGKLFRVVVAALVVHLLAVAAFPEAVGASLGRIPVLDGPLLHTAGLVLMALGGGLTMLSQWAKIGIPEEQDAPLVTSGFYAFSRNPIYAGMVTALTGTVLAVPNVVSVALALSAWISISYQIRMEETHLSRAFGEAYSAYCGRVRRWV